MTLEDSVQLIFDEWLRLYEQGDLVEAQELIARHEGATRSELEHLVSQVHDLRVDLERGASLPSLHEKFEGYELLEEIGRGGVGVVYRARRVDDGWPVAIKFLLAHQDYNEQARRRFEREASTVRRLDHPAIVRVLDSSEYDGSPFLVFQLVYPARTLASEIARLKEARSSLDRAHDRNMARIFCELAWALEHAHVAGVLHRDIKPANVLLNSEGEPVLSDFGVALDEHEVDSTTLTLSGQVLGTPAYMSPEQVASRVGIDARSDVYSLGACLYEMLCLERPFPGKSRQDIYRQIWIGGARNPRQIRSSLPRPLASITLKAIEKHPADRYQSAAELARDLERFLETGRARAGHRSLRGYVSATLRRRPRRWAVAVLLLSFFLGGNLSQLLATDKEDARVERADLIREQAAIALVSARTYLSAQQPKRALAMLDTVPRGWRGWEWEHLRLAADPTLGTLRASSSALVALEFVGEDVHWIAEDGTSGVWSPVSGEQSVWSLGVRVRCADIGPRGEWRLTVDEADQLRLHSPTQSSGFVAGQAVAEAGLIGSDGDLWFRTAEGLYWVPQGQEAQLVTDQLPLDRSAIAPDGTLCARVTRDQRVRLSSLDGEHRASIDPGFRRIETLQWVPGRQELMILGPQGQGCLWRIEDSVVQTLDLPQRAGSLTLAQDAAHALLWDRAGGSLERLNLESGESQRLSSSAGAPSAVALAPDFSRVAVGNKEGWIQVHSGAPATPGMLLEKGGAEVRDLAFARGRLAVGDRNGLIHIHHLDDGALAYRWSANASAVSRLAFLHDGTQLAVWTKDEILRVWSLSASQTTGVSELGRIGAPSDLAVDESGTRLAALTATGELWCTQADRWEPLELPAKPGTSARALSYLEDGRLVVLREFERSGVSHQARWDLLLYDEQASRWDALLETQAFASIVDVQGTGSEVLLLDARGTLIGVDASDGRIARSAPTLATRPQGLALGLEEDRIFVIAEHGVHVFDAARLEELCTLPRTTDPQISAIQFDPSSRLLAVGATSGSVSLLGVDARQLNAHWLQRQRIHVLRPVLEDAYESSETLEVALARLRSLPDLSLDEVLLGARWLHARGEPSPEALNRRAWGLLVEQGRSLNEYRHAQRFALQASRARPEDYNILHSLALAYYRTDQFEEALKTTEKVLRLEESMLGRSRSTTLATWALCLHATEETEAARSALRQASEARTRDGLHSARTLIAEVEHRLSTSAQR